MSAAGRILVVDDERGIRSLCGDVLRRAGHHVELAETGRAGVAAAAAGAPFDLVFCDINLPDIDGIEVLSQLLARRPAPTVILITAYPSVETAVRGMKLGARDYDYRLLEFERADLERLAREAGDPE